MLKVALGNLFHEKVRLVVTTLAVAFSITLIIIQTGILFGLLSESSRFIDNSKADIWLAQTGARSLIEQSILPADIEDRVGKVSGIDKKAGLIKVMAEFKVPDQKNPLLLGVIAFDPEKGLGGPWALNSGRGLQKTSMSEIILDSRKAKSAGLKVGDMLIANKKKFKIVGLSKETATMTSSNDVFVSYEGYDAIFPKSRVWNYLLIKASDQEKVGQLLKDLKELDGFSVYARQEFASSTTEWWITQFAPSVGTQASIALVVGTLIIGLAIYINTVDKLKEYAVLKAIGARNSKIYFMVALQSVAIGALGFGVGAGFSKLIEGPMSENVSIMIGGQVLLLALIVATFMSVTGSLLPLRKVAKVDPVVVMKA